MTRTTRHLTVAVLALFGLLFVQLNLVQVARGARLRDDPHNSRQVIAQYQRQRGPILAADGTPLARSVPTTGDLRYQRSYPYGPEFASLTGYLSLLYGSAGMERAQNGVLSGDDDRLFRQSLADILAGRTPQGGSVQLTVDAGLQKVAFDALGGQAGAAVALDPRTGAILAAVSTPTYDPNALASHDTTSVAAAWKRYLAAPTPVLVNRSMQALYPPGSTFKTVTTSAALMSGKYTPDTMVPAPNAYRLPGTDRDLHNYHDFQCGDGVAVPLWYAFQESCNTPFAALGNALGADALRVQAQAFGFDTPIDPGLPTATSRFPENPDPAQTALAAYGQFDVRMTPLQGAMIAAAIADGGRLMTPYLVQTVRTPNLQVVSQATPTVLRQSVSPAVAGQMTDLMVKVVQSGTGTAAKIPGVTVAGKTGTADHGDNAPPHAWFICFAPAEHPVIAVAVLVEDGGAAGEAATGGTVAAPIAKKIVQARLAEGP